MATNNERGTKLRGESTQNENQVDSTANRLQSRLRSKSNTTRASTTASRAAAAERRKKSIARMRAKRTAAKSRVSSIRKRSSGSSTRSRNTKSTSLSLKKLNSSSSQHAFKRQSNKIRQARANIVVGVRIRPESSKERDNEAHRVIVKPLDNKVVVFDPPEEGENTRKVGVPNHSKRHRNIQMAFDVVLDQYASQRQVYESTCMPVLDPVMDGYNATVFAYGATGAGKTHTMVGYREEEGGAGVMVLALQDLFTKCRQREEEGNGKYQICFSYLEVYNETIRDLLVESPGNSSLSLREDKGVCFVPGLTFHRPASAEELFQLLEKGNTRRAQSATGANATSSRSHAVLQILVEHRKPGVTTVTQTGKLSLVDLAGSERAAVTRNEGERMREGAKINRSLLALANCINALTNPNVKYIPFRDSKLTRLLRDSLGGNCRTVMIAAVSPSCLSADDSYNTLRYASRAKTIRCKPRRNVHEVSSRVHEYKRIINDLQGQVKLLRRQVSRLSGRDGGGSGEAGDAGSDEGASASSARSALLEAMPQLNVLFESQLKYRKALLRLQEVEHKHDMRALELQEKVGHTESEDGDKRIRPSSAMSPSYAKKLSADLAELKSKQRDGLRKRRELALAMSKTAAKYKTTHHKLAERGGLPIEIQALSATVTAHAAQIEKLDLAILVRRQQHQLECRELTARLQHQKTERVEQAQRALLQRCVSLLRKQNIFIPEALSSDIAALSSGDANAARTPRIARLLRTPNSKTPQRWTAQHTPNRRTRPTPVAAFSSPAPLHLHSSTASPPLQSTAINKVSLGTKEDQEETSTTALITDIDALSQESTRSKLFASETQAAPAKSALKKSSLVSSKTLVKEETQVSPADSTQTALPSAPRSPRLSTVLRTKGSLRTRRKGAPKRVNFAPCTNGGGGAAGSVGTTNTRKKNASVSANARSGGGILAVKKGVLKKDTEESGMKNDNDDTGLASVFSAISSPTTQSSGLKKSSQQASVRFAEVENDSPNNTGAEKRNLFGASIHASSGASRKRGPFSTRFSASSTRGNTLTTTVHE